MSDTLQERSGAQVLVCDPSGPPATTEQDALDLIGATYFGGDTVAVPAQRLDERFFTLETGLAGAIMQKFTSYGVRLAIIGDITPHLAASSALRALVRESNRARHVWFLPDLDALDERLQASR